MPKGWNRVTIGDVASPVERPEKPIIGTTYRQIGVQLWGQGAYERESIDGSQTRYTSLSRVESNDIIVNKIWARNGSVAVITDELSGCYGSGEFPTFAPNRELLEPKWFHWITKTKWFWQSCDEKSQGTSGKNRIRPEKFLEIKIPLPPLEEQRRIVARIEALAAGVSEVQQLKKDASEDINNLRLSAYRMTFQPRNSWITVKVGDVCESPQYGYTETATTEPVGPKFLRITDIQDGKVDWNNVPYCSCNKSGKYLLEPNDIVFARTGATTGKSFLIQDCPEAIFASYLIRIRVKHSITPEYLYKYFQSPDYWAQIADEKKGTGQPNVNGKKLANIRVPIPPIDEQHHIVSYLDDLQVRLDAICQLQTDTQKELNLLLPSILDRAFKGEL